MRILLVEDEIAIANFIAEGLQEEGFAVDTAHNGREGLRLALDNLAEYDLVLLDWMLPGVSGIEICRAIRKENKELPVIFLTAKDTVDDVVFGLETGANDYLRKPFAFEELLARMRVLLRSSTGEQNVFRCQDIELDVSTHQVMKAGPAGRTHSKRICPVGATPPQQRQSLPPHQHHRKSMGHQF
jgi:two-component system copper resistance phosphate regulon response regulator CusR